jgi:peptide/nickel transport system permease protein
MKRGLIIGSFLSFVFMGLACISFFWVPYDIETLDIANKLKKPSLSHWLGTDHFGRDIFSMIMIGARTSIAVHYWLSVLGSRLAYLWGFSPQPGEDALLTKL